MQYVWQHRLWMPGSIGDVDGNPVSVIDPGLINTNAGPDFFNAKVRIGDRLWVGNVEIHVRASDWHRHGHDSDPAYHSVVLHVVQHSDTRIRRPDGELIPQVVMPCAEDFRHHYEQMVHNPCADLPCAEYLRSLESIHVRSWVDALAHERLYAKSDRVRQLYERLGADWQAVIFVTLARALGFGLNSDPFERLALSINPAVMMKHRDNRIALEAILFGQAGLLNPENVDPASRPYLERLRQEYDFMATKFNLKPPAALGWKMARMRPQNFPHRRVAALAAIIAGGFEAAQRLFYITDAEQARALFDANLEGFWAGHSNFGAGREGGCAKAFSSDSLNVLIINVVVPILNAYSEIYGDDSMHERALDILHVLPAERNSIIRLFSSAGVRCSDAYTSQALIQLRREYCDPRKCLYCRIGHRYLATKATGGAKHSACSKQPLGAQA